MSDPTDIVIQLRQRGKDHRIELEAADEIERLRKELDARIAMCDMRSEKIGELVNERDEARRELCNNEANHLPTMADPRREAKRRGWDCFKKKTLKDCFKENA